MVLEGQLGALLHILLVGIEVLLGVLPAWRDRKWSAALTGSDGDREQEVGGVVCTFALPPDLGDGLAEVHVDAAVVDEHVVHLEVGLLTVLLLRKCLPRHSNQQLAIAGAHKHYTGIELLHRLATTE